MPRKAEIMKRLIVLIGFACILANGNPTDPRHGECITGWKLPIGFVEDIEELPHFKRIGHWNHPDCPRGDWISFRVVSTVILETSTSLEGPWEHVDTIRYSDLQKEAEASGTRGPIHNVVSHRSVEIDKNESMRFFRIRSTGE